MINLREICFLFFLCFCFWKKKSWKINKVNFDLHLVWLLLTIHLLVRRNLFCKPTVGLLQPLRNFPKACKKKTSLKWLSDLKRSLACNFSLVCNFWLCSRQYLQFLSCSRILHSLIETCTDSIGQSGSLSEAHWGSLRLTEAYRGSLRLINAKGDSLGEHWG